FNPANHSLFLDGMPLDNAVSEISIPSSVVNSTNLGALATASVLQQPVQVLKKLPSDPIASDPNGERLGGLAVVNGRLVGTDYAYYPGGDYQVSHFVLSSLNLATAQAGGLYSVGGQNSGLVGGYMAPV